MAPTATGSTATSAATPSTAAAAASSSSGSNAPSSLEEANQRYQATKVALRTGLANKRLIDRSLIDLESQIYLFEGSYLQSTATSGGNIVKGFDAYLKNSSSSSGGGRGSNANNAAALGDIPLEDRIFSLSSATYQKSLELKANEGLQDQEERENSTNNTPKASKKDAADAEASAIPTSAKKSKRDKEIVATAAPATPAGKDGKKKKDKASGDGTLEKAKDKERSSTPNLKSSASSGGKNAAAVDGRVGGSATPIKAGGAGGKAMGTGTKLKRKNTDGPGGSGAGTPGGKAGTKRKKEDE